MAEFVFGWGGTAEALRCQPGVADVLGLLMCWDC